MKRLLLISALALSLTGCQALGTLMAPPAPAAVANQTVLDEQGAIGVELAYKAARIAVEMAVDAGFLKGEAASRAAAADDAAFAAVAGVRAAYRAGNAQSYGIAMADARTAVASMLTAIGR